MARGVNSAIVDFLDKPVVSVLGEPGDDAVESAKATMAGWALSLARDPHTRDVLRLQDGRRPFAVFAGDWPSPAAWCSPRSAWRS